MARLALISLICLSATLSAQELSTTRLPELTEAQKNGASLTEMIVEKLRSDQLNQYVGIQSWINDYDKQFGVLKKDSIEQWEKLNLDELIHHNPRFWRMVFELYPGDSGLMLLVAGLYASAGESTLAGQFSTLAIRRRGIPKPFRRSFELILSDLKKLNEKANVPVFAGIQSYDRGDYGEALKKYQQSINLWPQNGFAWYEAGLTMMQQERIAAGKDPIDNKELKLGVETKLSAEVQQAFARARRSNPLEIRAYQGEEKELLTAATALNKKGLPAWEKITNSENNRISEETLTNLSIGLQEAKLDPMAILCRLQLIAQRNRFLPEDTPFFKESLKRLITETEADAILKRLSTPRLEFHQLVKPVEEKE